MTFREYLSEALLPKKRNIKVAEVMPIEWAEESCRKIPESELSFKEYGKKFEPAIKANIYFNDGFWSYKGKFCNGQTPKTGDRVELKYVGEIRKFLKLYDVEDERGFCFVYNKLN